MVAALSEHQLKRLLNLPSGFPVHEWLLDRENPDLLHRGGFGGRSGDVERARIALTNARHRWKRPHTSKESAPRCRTWNSAQ